MTFADLKNKLGRYLIERTDFLKVKDRMSEEQLRAYVDKAVHQLCDDEGFDITTETHHGLVREIVMATISLGPLRPLMEDETISEIMVNGPNQIYIQKAGRITQSEVKFESAQHVQHTVQKILAASGSNRRVDESSPFVDFSMPDGARVNVILPPCSLVGPVITIRKFAKDITTIDDLVNRKMLDKKMALFLSASIRAKMNIVFCGSTGTGKTTLLNVLSRHIPENERIITIEDTPELRLMQEHVVPLQSKPSNVEGRGEITIQQLFVNSLRMRPDRIILGEVRSYEMLDLIQAISSGHSGSLAVVHADSPEDCFNRMITMMMMTGLQLSVEEIRRQVSRAIDIIVHIELFRDGVRRITNVTDVCFDPGIHDAVLRDIFAFEQEKVEADGAVHGHWTMDQTRPSFYKKFEKFNVKLPDGFFA